jgi:uncharacterized SAM-binding protein YcdF (DUF218 family)
MDNRYVPDPSPVRLFPFSPVPPSLTLPPLDGLIVLGARLTPRGEPGRVAQVRLSRALELWRHGGSRGFVLLTGGARPGCGRSEARAMADWALDRVAGPGGEDLREALHACLILEEASRSTAASARHTLPLVQARGSRSVGLVTDALHIHRAMFLFRRHFVPQDIAVHPLPARGLGRRYLWLARMTLREGGAWVKVLGRLLLEGRQPG